MKPKHTYSEEAVCTCGAIYNKKAGNQIWCPDCRNKKYYSGKEVIRTEATMSNGVEILLNAFGREILGREMR